MKPSSLRIASMLIAILAWFALVLQFILILQTKKSTGFSTAMTVTNFFSFFTILSNILVALSCSIPVFFPASVSGRFLSSPVIQSGITLYIFIVGLVYNAVLRNIWSPTGWQLVADNLLHVVVPAGFILYWYFNIPRQRLNWVHIFPWLLFPLVYLAWSLIRGASVQWYPYPFLDVKTYGCDKVSVNVLFVMAAFVLCGLAIIAINRRGTLKESQTNI